MRVVALRSKAMRGSLPVEKKPNSRVRQGLDVEMMYELQGCVLRMIVTHLQHALGWDQWRGLCGAAGEMRRWRGFGRSVTSGFAAAASHGLHRSPSRDYARFGGEWTRHGQFAPRRCPRLQSDAGDCGVSQACPSWRQRQRLPVLP